MELSRQKYCSGLPLPSPGDLPDPAIEPGSPALQANPLLSEPPRKLRGTRTVFFKMLAHPLVGANINLKDGDQHSFFPR